MGKCEKVMHKHYSILYKEFGHPQTLVFEGVLEPVDTEEQVYQKPDNWALPYRLASPKLSSPSNPSKMNLDILSCALEFWPIFQRSIR